MNFKILNLSLIILTYYLLENIYYVEGQCGISNHEKIFHPNSSERIINGYDSKPGSWPWIVSLQTMNDEGIWYHFCGGTLIDLDLVITAAHCLIRQLRVVVGLYDQRVQSNSSNIIIPIMFIMHSKYNSQRIEYGYDIALIQLARKVDLSSSVGIICLPRLTDINLIINKSLITAGW